MGVKVAQKPFQTLGHIFAKPKDPVTKEQRTDAIYSIPCNDCDNEYIGQTKRQFGTRFFFAKRKIQLHSLNLQTNVASNYVYSEGVLHIAFV